MADATSRLAVLAGELAIAMLVLAESLSIQMRSNWLIAAIACSAITIPVATAQWIRLSLGHERSKIAGWGLAILALVTVAGAFGHIDPGLVAIFVLAVLAGAVVGSGALP